MCLCERDVGGVERRRDGEMGVMWTDGGRGCVFDHWGTSPMDPLETQKKGLIYKGANIF